MSGWSLLYYWQSQRELVFVLHLILYWFGWFSNDKGCFGPWDTCKSLGYQAEFSTYTYPCGSEGAPVTTEGTWPSSREPPGQAGQVGTCSPGQGCHLPALTHHPCCCSPERTLLSHTEGSSSETVNNETLFFKPPGQCWCEVLLTVYTWLKTVTCVTHWGDRGQQPWDTRSPGDPKSSWLAHKQLLTAGITKSLSQNPRLG